MAKKRRAKSDAWKKIAKIRRDLIEGEKMVGVPLGRGGNAHVWGKAVDVRLAFGHIELEVEVPPHAGWGRAWIRTWEVTEPEPCPESEGE